MNREDFQRLSKIRLREAKTLLDRRGYDGAYYLAGYAVECALKACIAKKTKRYEFPDKKVVERIYSHEFTKLLEAAGLKDEHRKQMDADRQFEVTWNVVKDWSEQSRYRTTERTQARDLYYAIAGRKHGVLRWLKKHW